MSGTEAFGVLGVLPLIISAAEHYNDCLVAFRRFAKYHVEIRRFHSQLKVQKTIFRMQCLLLLQNVTSHDAACSMLGEASHHLWASQDTAQQLADYLEESREACITCISLIEEELENVHEESRSLGATVKCDQDVWHHRIRAKLNFSLSESRLNESLQSLRSLNDDFHTLSSQRGSSSTETRGYERHIHQHRQDILKCQTVRMLSHQVYDALGRACNKHMEHRAHLSLRVEQDEAPHGHDLVTKKFKLAYGDPDDPVWFMIDSISHNSFQHASCNSGEGDDQLSTALEKQLGLAETSTHIPSLKKVGFRASLDPAPPMLVSGMVSSLWSSIPIIHQDFCDYLGKHRRQPSTEENLCLCVLEATERCRHLVYPLPSLSDDEDNCGTSLKGVLMSLSKHKAPSAFSRYDRLCLAKTLAIAILQYYTTPWLKIAWCSEDILFFRVQGDSQGPPGPDFSAPYLDVKVVASNERSIGTVQVPCSLALNLILFRLGIVLLEIAYSAPLRSLQLPCDVENGMDDQYNELFTARRLVDFVGREMGKSYSTIVKRLLHCDFGCGEDLDDGNLQAGYYGDVVCELDRLLQDF